VKNIIGQFKKMSKKKWWFVGVIILIVSGVGIYLTNRPAVKKVEIFEGGGLGYKVVSKTTKSCWAVVETDYIPSEAQLKATALKAWEDNKEITSVFLYLPGMDTGTAAYGIAKFISRGMTEFKVNTSALEGTKWE